MIRRFEPSAQAMQRAIQNRESQATIENLQKQWRDQVMQELDSIGVGVSDAYNTLSELEDGNTIGDQMTTRQIYKAAIELYNMIAGYHNQESLLYRIRQLKKQIREELFNKPK